MKVKADREIMLAKAQAAAKAVPDTATIPILDNLHVRFTKESAFFTGSDLHIQVTAEVPILSDGEISVCVPAKTFINTIKFITEPSIDLIVDPNQIVIKTGRRSKYKISCLPAEQFPFRAPVKAENEMSIDSGLLKDALYCSAKFINKDDNRINMTGTHVRIEDKFIVSESSDTFMMAIVKSPARSINSWSNVILPYALSSIVDSVIQTGMVVDIMADIRSVVIKSFDVKIEAALLDGKYPDTGVIMRKKKEESVKLNRIETEYILKRLKLYSGLTPVVRLEFSDNKVLFEATDKEGGHEGKEEIDSPHNIKTMVGVNADMFLTVLSQIEEPEFNMHVTSHNQPIFITPISNSIDTNNKDFFLMPMMI